jgi:hypothetical protein
MKSIIMANVFGLSQLVWSRDLYQVDAINVKMEIMPLVS